MNYKIKVTAENREAIKEIAERNGMNEQRMFSFSAGFYMIIENDKIRNFAEQANYQELTFDQFKAMFDKQETDLDKWLRETKAKNLSYHELQMEILYAGPKVSRNLEGYLLSEKAYILYNQWQKEHEYQDYFEPKEEPKPQAKIIGYEIIKDFPNKRNRKVGYIFLLEDNEDFKNFSNYPEFLKPVFEDTSAEPEKTFKDKVIEVIENEIKEGAYRLNELLDKIKELN